MKKALSALFVTVLTVGASLGLSFSSNAATEVTVSHHSRVVVDCPSNWTTVPSWTRVWVSPWRTVPSSPVYVVAPHHSAHHSFTHTTVTYTTYWEFVSAHGSCDFRN